MANVKISSLPSGSIPTDLDIIPIVDKETLTTTGVRASYLKAYITSSVLSGEGSVNRLAFYASASNTITSDEQVKYIQSLDGGPAIMLDNGTYVATGSGLYSQMYGGRSWQGVDDDQDDWTEYRASSYGSAYSVLGTIAISAYPAATTFPSIAGTVLTGAVELTLGPKTGSLALINTTQGQGVAYILKNQEYMRALPNIVRFKGSAIDNVLVISASNNSVKIGGALQVSGTTSFMGQVGIGTGSISTHKLNIFTTGTAGVVKIQNRNPTAASRYAAIDFYNHNDTQMFGYGYADPGVGGTLGGKAYLSSAEAVPFIIDGTGRIILGASTDVSGTLRINNANSAGAMIIRNSNGTPANNFSSIDFHDVSDVQRGGFGYAGIGTGDPNIARRFYVQGSNNTEIILNSAAKIIFSSTTKTEVTGNVFVTNTLTASALEITRSGSISGDLVVEGTLSGYGNAMTLLTASHTLSNGDNGRILVLTSPSQATLTVPTNLRQGFSISITQGGSGSIFVTGAVGTTIFNRLSHTKTAGQYAVASLFYLSGNAFLFSGDTQL